MIGTRRLCIWLDRHRSLGCIGAYANLRKPAGEATAQAIDAIIYSDLTREQMLERLKPFVSVDGFHRGFQEKDRAGIFLGASALARA